MSRGPRAKCCLWTLRRTRGLEAVDAVGIQRQGGVLRVDKMFFGAICGCRPNVGRVLWPCWDREGDSLECVLNINRHHYSDMCVCIVPF
jgi:hypothetical protein